MKKKKKLTKNLRNEFYVGAIKRIEADMNTYICTSLSAMCYLNHLKDLVNDELDEFPELALFKPQGEEIEDILGWWPDWDKEVRYIVLELCINMRG